MQRKTKKDTWWNWKHIRKQMPIGHSWRSKRKGREKVSSYILFDLYTYTRHTYPLPVEPHPSWDPLFGPTRQRAFGRGSEWGYKMIRFWPHSHETFNVKILLRMSQSAMSRAIQCIPIASNYSYVDSTKLTKDSKNSNCATPDTKNH